MAKTKAKTRESGPSPEKEKKLLRRIKPIGETHSHITALIYGRSGTGKTTLACSAPGPGLLIDIREDGNDSVFDVDGWKRLEVRSWEDLETLYWYLKANPDEYASIVLDTITQMQSLAILEVKERNNKDPEEAMTRLLWGEVSGLMQQWLMHYRDLPMNVFFLAQDREDSSDDDDDEQIAPSVGPAVMPSIAKTINAAVKVIGQTFIKETTRQKGGKILTRMEYRLRVGPHPLYVTKIRCPKRFSLPSTIKSAVYDDIIKVMRGEYGNGQD